MDRTVTHRRVEFGPSLRHRGESNHALQSLKSSRVRAGLQATSSASRHDKDEGAT
jgi:hypothetical protein